MTYLMTDFLSQTAIAAPSSLEMPVAAVSPLSFAPRRHSVFVTTRPNTVVRQIAKDKSLGEQLFDATAEAKRWTSQVAMRLDQDVRSRLFRQLDRLHDQGEWFEGDHPVDLESYKGFVRAYISESIGGKPGLALGQCGRVIAIWQHEANRLNIEFFSRDRVRYLVSQIVDGEDERFAGETSIGRLRKVLSPFESGCWFDGC